MRPLACFALGVGVGTAVWPIVQVPRWEGVLGAVFLLALAGVARSRLPMLAAGVCAGLALPASIVAGPALVGDWRVRGRVATAASGPTADVSLSAAGKRGEPLLPAQGRIRVDFAADPPPPGTAVAIEGSSSPITLTALPGEPDPAWEAARAGVVTRLRARDVMAIGWSAPPVEVGQAVHAGLLTALAGGTRAGIPTEDADLLRRTGTWHLISISGLHIGLSAMAAWAAAWLATRPIALRWRRGRLRWFCAAAATVAALAYAARAGWPVPARRSVWMVAISGACVAAGRRPDPWDLLGLGALGTLFAEPAAVGSVSFQLSFSALSGGILVAPRMMRFVPPDAHLVTRWITSAVAASVGATIGTLPIIAWRFQTLSLATPFANLWAIPTIGSIATPAVIAAQFLPIPLSHWALSLADAACTLGLGGLRLLVTPPLHPAVGCAGAFGLLVAATLRRHVLAALALAASALLLRDGRPGELVVTYLAVGQGDATLLRWPGGRTALVDGGPPGEALLLALRRLGVSHLDEVVLSHGHPDHYGGLGPVLRDLDVDAFRANAVPRDLDVTRVHSVVTSGGVPRSPFLLLGPPSGFVPADENDASLVVAVQFGSRRFLFAGDAEAPAERALLAGASTGLDLHADVLKVPHHGSRTSSTAEFLAAVHPSIAVIECGQGNRYGHPNADVLARYVGTRVYRTDSDGNITIRTDGVTLTVEQTEVPTPWRLRVPASDRHGREHR